MINKEKANELLGCKNCQYKTSDCDQNGRCIYMNTIMDMAGWKDKQYEDKIRELLNKSFYLHPHNSNMICSDDFECNDSFEDFVEEFIKRIKEIEV